MKENFNIGDKVYAYTGDGIYKGRIVGIKSNKLKIKISNETYALPTKNVIHFRQGAARELAEAVGLRNRCALGDRMIPQSVVLAAIARARKRFAVGENKQVVYDCLKFVEKRIMADIDNDCDYVIRVRKLNDDVGIAMTGAPRWDYASLDDKTGRPCWSSQNNTISFETAEGARQFVNDNIMWLSDFLHDFSTVQIVRRKYDQVC